MALPKKTSGSDIRSLVASNAVLDRLVGVKEKSTIFLQNIDKQLYSELQVGLLTNNKNVIKYIGTKLEKIFSEYGHIIEKYNGLELIHHYTFQVEFREYIDLFLNICFERGLYVRKCGEGILIKPPIIINKKTVDRACCILEEALNEFKRVVQ